MSNKSKRKLFKKLIRKMDKTEGSFGLLGHCILMAGLEVPLMAHLGVISMVPASSKETSTEASTENAD